MSLLGHLPPNLTWIKSPLTKALIFTFFKVNPPYTHTHLYPQHFKAIPRGSLEVAAVASQKARIVPAVTPRILSPESTSHISVRGKTSCSGSPAGKVVCEHSLQICVISYLEVRFSGRSTGPGIPHPNTGSAKALPSCLIYFSLLFNIITDKSDFYGLVRLEWWC